VQHPPPAASEVRPRMKVLIVEDEAALSDVLTRSLRARAFEVRAAGSARGTSQPSPRTSST